MHVLSFTNLETDWNEYQSSMQQYNEWKILLCSTLRKSQVIIEMHRRMYTIHVLESSAKSGVRVAQHKIETPK